ncbi:hypothetical protein [Luteolibacter sp. LG18]|uniref:hypothetical protein n=1 Tax=Luteolibacter sp. LG18 TaxID=2819286 RepID=UPI002B2A7828|nr:hypothetical protein llg_24820 [Luteolibacter sp. LG18]
METQNPTSYPPDPHLHASHAEENKPSFWKKLGGGSLSISLIVHAILLAIGVVWIFQIIPAQEAKVDFMPKGGGGGSPGVKEVSNKKQRATMTNPNTPRMAAKGVAGTFTLPEPDAASAMSSVGSLSSGGLSGGLGGSGSGGGRGDGHGTGFGSGMGPGLGGGGGAMSPFGMVDPNANALVGTFYNLNHRANGADLEMNNDKHWDAVHDFVTRGWKDAELSKFQQAPKKLYQTKIYMPAMAAGEAPKAFGVTPDPHPRWIVVYRGMVTAAKSGKFRFVGAGDDSMVVRFNNRNVFDYGYVPGTIPLAGFQAALKSSERLKGPQRDCPMEPPVTFYQYPSTADWNRGIGGVAVGPEISVQAGQSYPIDILITEGWGGLFSAGLMIQETGAAYQKASSGSPILPLFRTDDSLPTDVKGDNLVPYEPQGPVWRINQTGRKDI